jgi:hypothetical protein
LSIACPIGLSEAAVLNDQYNGRLYGVVTENIEVSTEVSAILEVDDKGQQFRERYHNIIRYGLCVWLPKLADWLNSQVPPVPNDEINRRAENQNKWRAEEQKGTK